MSFKREGDDPSQLNLLKKRRVAELLANDVPDDEAILMRNGRYACTVCGHHPVFDTVDMLAVHRGGKKHKKCLDYQHARKRSLAQEILKRKQEREIISQEMGQIADNQVEAPLLQKTRISVKNALLKGAPYDSRSKSHQSNTSTTTEKTSKEESKGLFFQKMRRQRLQISQPSSSEPPSRVSSVEVTNISVLPGNSPSISKPNSNFPELHMNQPKAKQFSLADEAKPVQLQPYVSKSKRKSNTSQDHNAVNPFGPRLVSIPAHKTYKPPGASWEELNDRASYSCKDIDFNRATDCQSHEAFQDSKTNRTTGPVFSLNKSKMKEKESKSPEMTEENNVQTQVMQELLHKDAKKNAALEQVQQAMVGKKTEKPHHADAMNIHSSTHSYIDDPQEKRKRLQHHLQLTSSGWKTDRSGNWIQDEEAEFDSDEEAPPCY